MRNKSQLKIVNSTQIHTDRSTWKGNCRGRSKPYEFYIIYHPERWGYGTKTRCLDPCGNRACSNNFSEKEIKKEILRLKKVLLRRLGFSEGQTTLEELL